MTGAGGTQSIQLLTSCSQPLNLGDRFGAFVVFGMDRVGDGAIALGGVVEYQYKVTNPNAFAVQNVTVLDDQVIGPIGSGISLDPDEMITLFDTRTLFDTTTNTATVTGDAASGGVCQESNDSVTVTVTSPPAGLFDCKDAKPIDELMMAWAPLVARDICVVAYDGAVGGTVLATIDDVMPDDVVTVSGMSGSPNDQQWEIFAAGDCNGTSLGVSEFHISCSDSDMNGVEDCGKNEGDGKSNDPTLINDWLLEGITGANAELECTP